MNRLRAFRNLEGINQHELGEMLGISTAMVSAIESGRRQFNGDLEVLGYGRHRLELPDMSPPLHRHRASTSAAAKKRAAELLRLAGEVFAEMRERTPNAPDLALHRLPQPESPDDLEEAAIEVRALLDHDEYGPIKNLTASIERAGVCVVPIAGLKGIDGLSAWVEGTPVIGVSPTVPGDRFRLTLGHEVAHLLLHRVKSDRTEREANRFSAALLIPHHEFDAAMPERPQLRDFMGLKATWGVSVAALVYRAHELDYINDQRYRALQIQMSKWRKNEPAGFPPKHGKLVSKLIEVNGGHSVVARDLGVNPSHLRELSNWSHLRRV